MEFCVYSYIASLIILWNQLPLTESSVNLALHKSTSQSSNYSSIFPSSNAVDGLNKQCVSDGLTHTLDGNYEWWQVDLGEMCEIRKIQIYYRTNLLNRLDGYAIDIIKSLNPLETWQCYKDTDNTIPTNPAPSHICPRLGRYVKFSREKTIPDNRGDKAVINLCELEVYGCPKGLYGYNCNSNCDAGCLNARCDPENGQCNTTHCTDGTYFNGESCVGCHTGCFNNCNPGNGQCLNGCKQPFYGTFCNLTCSTNCYNTSCRRDNGGCFGCKTGLHGSKCDATCPRNCKDNVCGQDNGHCTSCNHPYEGNTCTNCSADSYFSGAICIPCSTGCVNNNCNARIGECLDGCKPSFYGTFCNLSCPITCSTTSCRRDNGECFGCKTGLHGSKCDVTCPKNCKDNVCRQDNGYCTSCNYPYEGIICTECIDGYYGDKCKNCSEGCLDRKCDQQNGHCTCKESFFGKTCNQSCSENCKNSRCYQTTGDCVEGCETSSFNGKKCNECADGKYGENCDNDCPSNCNLTRCYKTDGSCPYGCKHKNMFGSKCDGIRTTTEGQGFQINSYIGSIIAGVVSLINIVFIVVILVLYCKRRRRKETVYENQKPLDWKQEGMNQQDNNQLEQQQTVHYETLGLHDRGSVNTNAAQAYTGLNVNTQGRY